MTFNVFENKEEAINVLARYFIQLGNDAIAEKGIFTVALSGGLTPQRLHYVLSTSPFRDELEWKRVYFFFGDERYVPCTDKDSNYRMANETLFQPLGIQPHRIFKIDTTLSPEAAARDYEQTLKKFFINDEKVRFDLILLGMGDNAHTASLFPYSDILHDVEPAVRAVELPEEKTWRITLNAPMINNAARIAFLVIGPGKAEAVKHVISPSLEEIVVDLYPAQLIRNERVAWFTDKEAAALTAH
jgi:6-phosphogluconolactonase